MLTDAWFQLRYHAQQAEYWRSTARFKAVAAGRGSGKTLLARRKIVRWLPVKKPWNDPKYFYALPTLPQAKRVAWEQIRALIPSEWIAEENKTELRIKTIFGSTLFLYGMDRPHRAEGLQYDGGIVDEASDERPSVVPKTFLPALSERTGWLDLIGVPKRFGIGATYFKQFCDELCDEYYHWPSSDIVGPAEIENAKRLLDARDFDEQYNASWLNATGQIFYAFNESWNVTNDAQYNENLPIIVGSDFNVNPMAWVLGHWIEVAGNICFLVFDNIFRRDTNTEKTLDYLYAKYGTHTAGWEFYGDATAAARKTSATISDYLQIKNDKRFSQHGNAKVFYSKSNPLFINRVAACNAMLRNARGEVRVFIHPQCKPLINDLSARSWKENSREPDDFGDMGHISDAFGYPIYKRFPLRLEAGKEIQSKVMLLR